MTVLSSYGEAAVDMTASAQNLALCISIQFDRKDLVQSLIGPDGSILLWAPRTVSYPPSLALIRQGNVYTIVLSGTQAAIQFANHLYGTFVRGTAGETAGVNGQFLQAWQDVWALVAPLIAAPLPSCVIRLTGFSFGGAVATIGGVTLARLDQPPLQVQVMTAGAPMSYTGALTPPVPTIWGWWSYQDPVPLLPQAGAIIVGATPWTLPLVWLTGQFGWGHVGTILPLGPDGTVGQGGATPDPLPPGVGVGVATEHSITNYNGRLRAWWGDHGRPVDMGVAIGLTLDALSGDDPQTQVPGLPTTVAGPDGSPVTIPLYFGAGTYPSGPDGVEPMAFPTALTGGTPYVITRYINYGPNGWTERQLVYMTGTSPSNTLANAQSAANQMNAARQRLLSVNSTIVGTRIGVDGQPGSARLYTKAPVAPVPGLRVGIPTQANVSWVYETWDLTGTVRGHPEVRGLVQSDSQLSLTETQRNKLTTPAQVQQYATQMTAILVGQNGLPSILGQGAFPTTQRDPTINPLVPVTAWGVDANGYLQITVPAAFTVPTNLPSPAPATRPVAPSDRIQINLVRSRCSNGISGTYPVITVTGSGGAVTYTVRKRPCCSSAQVAALVGRARPVYRIYVALATFAPRWLSTRDTGRAFFVGAGKASARCC